MSDSAPLAEIFSSFQGEGIHVGVRQVFVRLRGCRLTCRYCDTAAARQTRGPCRIERDPGSNRWEQVTNPMTPDAVAMVVAELAGTAPHHSVSITGGEPLCHPVFVAALAERLRGKALRTYLDTACCYPDGMAAVAPSIGIVAADYKLPVTMEEPVPFDDFAASWQAIIGQRFLKIVLTDEVQPGDLGEHCARLAALDPRMQVVLQPATASALARPPDGRGLFALMDAAAAHLPTVRLIPQTHPLLGVR